MQCYVQHEDVDVFNSYGCVRNFHKIRNILDHVRLEHMLHPYISISRCIRKEILKHFTLII